ncbi:GntR family transcriptional regulator [Gilliamella sp. B2840]|uniref:GntR family transcriptional regulator n=1 Tax=unclassified Gilliamella TaxID=2685620 RepID=UPI00226A2975|nr:MULTISPECIES: GntR family transcriptional regulator [unclassified Gilliamella]MCX8657139.1 GntR family transcriptional regulator [Gilliamella sp. B2894]MCX8664866.1 GntR family transcriptional regulator [Gilliamella sp. B2887]MCX8693744.1 GntR family transcriptional regulator [Gilliamella sp. B2881]MCX8696117.1 GntR family transcriptional regulator [Gilliamella sp. B2828]MCX8697462.1 GntR family transcriptional regulator [Gilliamella sp. B3000]
MLKYRDVAKKIQQAIYQQNLPKDTQLPNIEGLINQYQVSRTTIIKALNCLERHGVIYQIQGSGIFVRQPQKRGYLNFLESHGFSVDLNDSPNSSQVFNVDIVQPSSKVKQNLQCDDGEEVYFIKRLRKFDDKVYALEQSYYRKKMIGYLNKEIAEHSIFSYIKDIFKINIGFSDKYFKAIKLDKQTAVYLGLNAGDPALCVEEIFYTSAGEPFDFSTIIYHYDNAKFYVQSNSK